MPLGVDPQTVGPQLQQTASAFSLIDAYADACVSIVIQRSYPVGQINYSLDQIDPAFAANVQTVQLHAFQWQRQTSDDCKLNIFSPFGKVNFFVTPIWDALIQLEYAISNNGGAATPAQHQQVNYISMIASSINAGYNEFQAFNTLLVQDQKNLVSGDNSIYEGKQRADAVFVKNIQQNAGYVEIMKTWEQIREAFGDSLNKLSATVQSLGSANLAAQNAVSQILTQCTAFQNLVGTTATDLSNASDQDVGSRLQRIDIVTSKNMWNELLQMVAKACGAPQN